MKQIMLSIIAVVGLAGSTSLSYAEDTGKTSNEMKSEIKGQKDDRKVKPDNKNMKNEETGQKDKSNLNPMNPSDMKGKIGDMGTHKRP